MRRRLVTARAARSLCAVLRPYKDKAGLGAHWRGRTADQLWLRVLSQIVVAGSAGAGDVLAKSVVARRELSIRRLLQFGKDTNGLKRHLHRVLRAIGTRYVGDSWRNNRKVNAAASNFRILGRAGGPRKFFAEIARKTTTNEKVATLISSGLQYYGKKGARDTLLGLQLADDCIALDQRIQGLLREVGVNARLTNENYEQIEHELLQGVAKPMGLSGARLDAILFQHFGPIRADLRLMKARS